MPTPVIAFLLPTAAKKFRKPVRTASSFNKNTQVRLVGFWGGFRFGAPAGFSGGMAVGGALGTIAGAYFCYP
jgi:hypothetical protein